MTEAEPSASRGALAPTNRRGFFFGFSQKGLDGKHNKSYKNSMQHTKEPSTNTRIWVKTRKKFKIVAALTDSSIVEVMERLAEQEFKRIQYKKVQYKG